MTMDQNQRDLSDDWTMKIFLLENWLAIQKRVRCVAVHLRDELDIVFKINQSIEQTPPISFFSNLKSLELVSLLTISSCG